MDTKSKKHVKLYFVSKEGCNLVGVNDCMKMAYQEAVEAGLAPKWLTDEEAAKASGPKNTVFILQEFEGDLFETLSKTKSVICGPMCLRTCIAEGLDIPDNKSPVFTTAMRNIIVTASQVSPATKIDIKRKVGYMGGLYMNNLVESVTHLVTDSVRSSKYEIAGERGIPAMTVGWVEAVWKESQKKNIKATDPDIVAKYKCPIFMNMFITGSNLSRSDRAELRDLIIKNGGTFTGQLRIKETTLLIVDEPYGDKYQAARNWDLPCVRPSYIKESVARGYALPSQGHLVLPTVSCSTPTKEDDAPNFTCNSEAISMIHMDMSKSSIDESQATICTRSSQQHLSKPSGTEYTQILSSLNMPDAKKAGSFVDGCKIYLSGFSDAELEKLKRILSLGGATLFTELSESTSHMIVGEFVVNDMRTLTTMAQKPHVVTLDWVVASVKQQSPANEEAFYCLETRKVLQEPPSPLSQKGMQLLQPAPGEDNDATTRMPPPTGPPVSRKLLSQFISENARSPAKNNTSVQKSLESTSSSAAPDVFQGLNFLIAGFDDESTSELEELIVEEGGCVVAPTFTGVADYAIVPVQATIPNITAVEVVTNLWVEECRDSSELVSVKYYHQPLSLSSDKTPLSDCCVSISTYGGKEKAFLVQMVKELGGIFQDVLARVNKQEKGIVAATHLLCPKPEGQKFTAAVKWKVPVVTKEWLLACARQGVKISEAPYLVGDNEDLSCSRQTPGRSVTENVQTTTTPVSHPPSEPVTPAPGPSHPVVDSLKRKNLSCSKQTPGRSVTENIQTTTTPVSHPPSEPVTPAPGPSHPVVDSLKRKSMAQTPEDYYNSPFHVSTPDTPYGQVFGTPTAEDKKDWKRFINQFPDWKPTSPPPKISKRLSTPLSEIKRRIWAKALETSTSTEEESPLNSNEGNEEEMDSPKTPNNTSSKRQELEATPKSSSKKEDCENFHPRKLSYGRATPTAIDFKSSTGTPSDKPTENSPMVKKSTPNERVSALLGKLNQRHNTPGSSTQEQPLPQRELVQPPIVSDKPVVSLTESEPVLGWEDPVESAERAKIHSSTVERPRRFVLSNLDDNEYDEKLAQLGETVVFEVLNYEPEVTHLIVDELLRSEKLLCCIAAGKWILHTSFIDYMVEHKQYIPEEFKFEWGNPANAKVLPRLRPGSIGDQLAQAAVRWRKQGGGAFSGMRAIILVNSRRQDSYRRLIEAGRGQVVPYTKVSEATHCFVEERLLASLPIPLSVLVTHKVPCLPHLFLNDLLIKSPPPSPEDCLIAEYRRLRGNQH